MSRHRKPGLRLTTRGAVVLSGVVGIVMVLTGILGGRWLDQRTLWGPLAHCEQTHHETCIVTDRGIEPRSDADRRVDQK